MQNRFSFNLNELRLDSFVHLKSSHKTRVVYCYEKRTVIFSKNELFRMNTDGLGVLYGSFIQEYSKKKTVIKQA